MAERTLRFSSGPGAGREIEIDREIVVGREGADLTIDDAELSRRHATFRPLEKGVEVEDLDSLNGTFIDGRRISDPQVVTAPAKIKLGTNEGTIELALPEVTRASEPILTPDLTIQREVASPELTAKRDVASPEVTAQRPVAGADVTVKRPLEQAGPPGGHTPPAASPKPSGGGGRGPMLPMIIGAVSLVTAVAAVILLSGGSDGTEKRQLDVTIERAAATAEDERVSQLPPGPNPRRWTLLGEVEGPPFGTGTITTAVTLEPGGPPPGTPKGKPPPGGKPKPARVTSRFTMRFEGGTVIATGTARSRRVGNSVRFSGTGRVIDGTGDFGGAKGTFKVTGRRPKFEKSFETVDWQGSVEY